MSITVTIERWPHDPTGRAITVQVHEDGVARGGIVLTRDAEQAQVIVRDTIARVFSSAPDGRKPLTPEQVQDLRSRLDGPSAPIGEAVALAKKRALDAQDSARRRRIRERITGRSASADPRDSRDDSAGEAVSA